jgi:NTE family protein
MKIGIALGSGAARGWAHIGVLQALEELGIEIEVVAGCSIGSYVGAALASGKLQELADWVTTLTEWQVLGLMGVGLHRGGLVSGQKVFQALQDNFSEESFEQLKFPLGIVATDLYSGKEVSFTSGKIIDGVRASCAIPGLFPPSHYQGRWLVDGGVVNSIPVNLCRHLGADRIIAVNLSSDFRPQEIEQNKKEHEKNQQKITDFFSRSQSQIQNWFKSGEDKGKEAEPEEISPEPEPEALLEEQPATTLPPTKLITPSMIGVMSSSLDILQARVTRSRLAGDPPDILIEPQLRDFGMMEFYRAKELIEEGRNSVNRIADQIRYQLRLD